MRSRYAPALAASIALHILAVLIAARVTAPLPASSATKPRHAVAVFVVPPTEDATFAGLKPVDRAHDEWTRPQGEESSALEIANIRIDVDKIQDRATVLFPFVTPGLSLEHFFPAPRSESRTSLENPFPVARRRRDSAGSHQPLAMSDSKLQSLVDDSWSRRDRWAAFGAIARLAQMHDADAGQLPALLQKYRDQNSLQPFADTKIRDPRLWAQLGIAADHVTFIAFIRRFASEHPSTRATTELLFLLDRIAEANADALDVLRDSDPPERLAWTRQTNADAYRLIIRIRGYYQRELNRLGLMSDAAVAGYYDRVRLAILQGILRTTPDGYRANDARFLIGAIYWRQQNRDAALRSWHEMSAVDPGDSYVIAASQIAGAVRAGTASDALLERDIDRILKNQQGRWVMFSYDRLRRFGHRFDSF